MEKGDLDGAADDGVDPKPPAGAEDGTGDARTEDRPQLCEIHLKEKTQLFVCLIEKESGEVEIRRQSSGNKKLSALLVPLLFRVFAFFFFFFENCNIVPETNDVFESKNAI